MLTIESTTKDKELCYSHFACLRWFCQFLSRFQALASFFNQILKIWFQHICKFWLIFDGQKAPDEDSTEWKWSDGVSGVSGHVMATPPCASKVAAHLWWMRSDLTCTFLSCHSQVQLLLHPRFLQDKVSLRLYQRAKPDVHVTCTVVLPTHVRVCWMFAPTYGYRALRFITNIPPGW